MYFFYHAFGLNLQANRPIPGLAAVSHKAGTDVRIDLAGHDANRQTAEPARLWYKNPRHDPNGRALLTVWKLGSGAHYRFRYSDGAEFLVNRSASRIRVFRPPSLTTEDMAIYLLGPILGFVLRLRGVVCLHASAVAFEGAAIAFLNPAIGGKSTTAAAFALQGFQVLSDDIVALSSPTKVFEVRPAYPMLRLWPPSVEALFGTADALPRLTPEAAGWDKRYLDLNQENFRFQNRPLPLAAIYTGQPSAAGKTPRVEAVKAREALLIMIANSYMNYLLDRTQRSREFSTLSRLAATVPLRRVRAPIGLDNLARLCDAIQQDFQTLNHHADCLEA